jgi:hypothetical protein
VAVAVFAGPTVTVVDEAVVDETSFVDRVRLLLAKVSEKKKQLPISRMIAANTRQFDVLIKVRIGVAPCLNQRRLPLLVEGGDDLTLS